MTGFVLACVGLVVLTSLFYGFTGSRRRRAYQPDAAQANLEWYHLRRAELADTDDEALQRDIQLRLLEDDSTLAGADTELQVESAQGFPRWLLLPLIGLAASALYYKLGAAPDVLIARALNGVDENSSAQQMGELQSAIEARAAQRPGNLHYVSLLGRFYMGAQDYSSAATAYGRIVSEVPGDAQALAYAAQAEYLAAGRQLSDKAQILAEQALAVNPHQRTALGLLGMAAFEQSQYRAAISYWQRLMATEDPGSESAKMIAGVIAQAQQKLGGATPAEESAVADAPDQPGAISIGVSVRVQLPEGAQLSPSDTVFVLARAAGATSKMPVAVQRLSAHQLPVVIRLDDSKSMAGQKLSDLSAVEVVAQVSPDGRPGEASATWVARLGPLEPSASAVPQELILSPVSP